jgi:hypothetical protein
VDKAEIVREKEKQLFPSNNKVGSKYYQLLCYVSSGDRFLFNVTAYEETSNAYHRSAFSQLNYEENTEIIE